MTIRYRSQEEIVYDILKILADSNVALARWTLANYTYSNLNEVRKYVQVMLDKELVTSTNNKISITEKGLRYMILFNRIRNMIPQILIQPR